MWQPVLAALDKMLTQTGSESVQLGNASLGLIAAPFTPSKNLTLAGLTEASFSGYARKSIGTPSIGFTGGDGNEYVEGVTVQFMPSDTITPNTIYGIFLTFGNDSSKLWGSDALPAPVSLAGPQNQITITPRIGLNPGGNFGANVISN